MADAALSSAFVPVFSELLENKKRREAYQLASALAGLLLVGLTLITLAFILLAPVLIPLFTGDEFTPALDALGVGLSQVLFPIVILLGLTGLAVGILNVHDQFAIPAIAPLVWNIVIIAGMVGLAPLFEGDDKLYAYAIGVVAGTLVQLLMMLPALRAIGFPVWRIRLPEARRRARQARAGADAAGLGRPRPDQHQPAAEHRHRLARRRLRCRARSTPPSAIYMLPQGDVQRRRGDRALPAARAPRRPRRLRGHAADDRRRPARRSACC